MDGRAEIGDGRAEIGDDRVGVPRLDESGLILADVCQRPKAVHLQLKDVIVAVEWFAKPDQV